MSWNQSVCFLKNKLAWAGCGLVWQVWSDMFRLGLYSFGGSGLGLAGKVRWR